MPDFMYYFAEQKNKQRMYEIKIKAKGENYNYLANDKNFISYLMIIDKRIKKEYCFEVIEHYITLYTTGYYLEQYKDIHLFANILLILDNKELSVIKEQLDIMLLSISKEDRENIEQTFKNIMRYAKKGNLLKSIINDDTIIKKYTLNR